MRTRDGRRLLAGLVLAVLTTGEVRAQPLANSKPLELEGDIASQLLDGAHRFVDAETERVASGRETRWRREISNPEGYTASVEPQRRELARILGVRDARVPFAAFTLDATLAEPALVGAGAGVRVFAISWPAFGDVVAHGLLLEPRGGTFAQVVAIPDADTSPEALVGVVEGVPSESRFAWRLAENGCRVIVPSLVSRRVTHRRLTDREFLYRSAFELGRHIIGYEVQKILAAVDGLERRDPDLPLGVYGYGEGGLLALAAGALDTRIGTVAVSGYFGPREDVWREPIYRNVFGLLENFGDAEIASLVAPRALIVEAARGVELEVPPGTGGGPGRLVTPGLRDVEREIERARRLTRDVASALPIVLVESGRGEGPCGSEDALTVFVAQVSAESERVAEELSHRGDVHAVEEIDFAARIEARLALELHELDRHNQALLADSANVRREFFKALDTSSLERFEATVEPYREHFRDRVIGRFDRERLPANPRSRRVYETDRVVGYELVLDVFPEVIAYGILLLPRELVALAESGVVKESGVAKESGASKESPERRPVVVCQHGLEGRPQDLADPDVDHRAYHTYAVRLAERGFITFSPQNLYIFQDRFRSLQRKLNPIGKTLFSVIVPQHQQIVDWLGSLPYVDPERIGFYGLSYGGKTAMRVPPLVSGYCLSICSADFNEWVWKNASTRSPYSYVWTGEYEIFEFDLGSTFNYAEMAALIAPRPFFVERGHFDGVAPDETVAYEFAKVRHLYQAKLGLGDRVGIEWFVGPHTIHGVGTFAFLHEHLRWPAR